MDIEWNYPEKREEIQKKDRKQGTCINFTRKT